MNRAGRREWIGLGVIALACMLYSMDLAVLNLAVPSLSADSKPTSAELVWIVDITAFSLPDRSSRWAHSATASVAASC